MECSICRDKIESDEQYIQCGHCFHYHCIYTSLYFLSKKTNKMECPVCRCNPGRLPVKDGYNYILGVSQTSIHNYCKKCCKQIKKGEFCSKHKPFIKCKYVLTRGKNKGQTCDKNADTISNLCIKHMEKNIVEISTTDLNRIKEIALITENNELLDIVNKY